MPTVHFLNVSPGDCSIIQHASGHVSMIDVCDGNLTDTDEQIAAMSKAIEDMVNKGGAGSGNFRMAESPTNPIKYAKALGINSLFRFILSHPDMDHMDGLDAVYRTLGIKNFWDAGVTREKPPFGGTQYKEEDWDRYALLRDGKVSGVTSLSPLAGALFQYANRGQDGTGGGDGLYILSPDKNLVAEASAGDDINDGSYVILYRSQGGRVIFAGDAHDGTWDYVLENYASDVENCSVLVAPHHGRDSGRSYDFLDHIKPKLTLFGNAPSEHLAYAAWNSRSLTKITSNQAGNIVLKIGPGAINVYVENDRFATSLGANAANANSQGYVLLYSIPDHKEVKSAA
jgi:beta-lactamase superfamily II metal-dependent hydrolase